MQPVTPTLFHTDRVVIYTRPFTTYAAWDTLRVIIVVVSVLAVGVALSLASFRWGEGRQSAAVWLVTISVMLLTNSVAMIHGLGHPGTWVLWMYLACGITACVAALMVIREVKAGRWRT